MITGGLLVEHVTMYATSFYEHLANFEDWCLLVTIFTLVIQASSAAFEKGQDTLEDSEKQTTTSTQLKKVGLQSLEISMALNLSTFILELFMLAKELTEKIPDDFQFIDYINPFIFIFKVELEAMDYLSSTLGVIYGDLMGTYFIIMKALRNTLPLLFVYISLAMADVIVFSSDQWLLFAAIAIYLFVNFITAKLNGSPTYYFYWENISKEIDAFTPIFFGCGFIVITMVVQYLVALLTQELHDRKEADLLAATVES
mmetsp:Transcript_5729/g.9103  ORF Transcript_5729/g.9103 Transcript_5729/m.9103 type:complete len:257 (-) Transcript_5729:43-813(-)